MLKNEKLAKQIENIEDKLKLINGIYTKISENDGFLQDVSEFYAARIKYIDVESYLDKLLKLYKEYFSNYVFITLNKNLSRIYEIYISIDKLADNKNLSLLDFTSLYRDLDREVSELQCILLNEALSSQYMMIESRVSNIEELKSELRGFFDELKKNTIDDIRHNSLQIKNNMLDSLNENTEDINRRINETEGALSNFKAKFDEHTKMLFELDNKVKNTVDQIIDNTNNQIVSGVDEVKVKSEEDLKAIEISRKTAEKLLGIIGNLGLAGSFKSIATKEEKNAFYMRLATIFFLLVGVGFAIYSMLDFVHSLTNHLAGTPSVPVKDSTGKVVTTGVVLSSADIWAVVVLRVVTTFMILTPALYFIKESNRHRENADRSGRIEAELISLLAFIEDMDKPDRVEVRKKLSDRYFVGNTYESKFNKDSGLPTEFLQKTIEKIVDKSVDVFGDVTKKKMTGDREPSTDGGSNQSSRKPEE